MKTLTHLLTPAMLRWPPRRDVCVEGQLPVSPGSGAPGAFEPLTRHQHLTPKARDAKFQTMGDQPCFLDEELGRRRRAEIASRCLEQRKPAIEVRRLYWKWGVGGHRPSMIATAHQRHR